MTLSPLRAVAWVASLALLAAGPGFAQSEAEPSAAGEAAPDEAAIAAGREVFLEAAKPGCPVCHALADAGSAGEIGPDLDALAPDAARVRAAVSGGVGVMPAYDGLLTAEQIDAVAAYVSAVAGSE